MSKLNTPVSYLELLTELSGKYGKPAESGCRAEDEITAIQCTLRWEMKDVLIEALIRTAFPEGGLDAQSLLAVTATDIRPDSSFIGLKENKDKEKTSFPDAQIKFTSISLPGRPIRVSIFDKSQ